MTTGRINQVTRSLEKRSAEENGITKVLLPSMRTPIQSRNKLSHAKIIRIVLTTLVRNKIRGESYFVLIGVLVS